MELKDYKPIAVDPAGQQATLKAVADVASVHLSDAEIARLVAAVNFSAAADSKGAATAISAGTAAASDGADVTDDMVGVALKTVEGVVLAALQGHLGAAAVCTFVGLLQAGLSFAAVKVAKVAEASHDHELLESARLIAALSHVPNMINTAYDVAKAPNVIKAAEDQVIESSSLPAASAVATSRPPGALSPSVSPAPTLRDCSRDRAVGPGAR